MKSGLSLVLTAAVALLLSTPAARADESKDDVKKMVERGLDWLAATQNKADGNFEANGGQYPTTMTSILCKLMRSMIKLSFYTIINFFNT